MPKRRRCRFVTSVTLAAGHTAAEAFKKMDTNNDGLIKVCTGAASHSRALDHVTYCVTEFGAHACVSNTTSNSGGGAFDHEAMMTLDSLAGVCIESRFDNMLCSL